MTSLQSLDALFIDELRDIYNAERQLLKALPTMSKHAKNPRLADAFSHHLKQTEGHAERLERILQGLEGKVRGKKCLGMEGLIAEGKEVLEAEGDDDTLDAALIGAAQRVEHYEIAAYGTACAHARTTGNNEALRLLEATLEEEKEADRILSEIAEGGINEESAEMAGSAQMTGNAAGGNGGSTARNGRSKRGSPSRATTKRGRRK